MEDIAKEVVGDDSRSPPDEGGRENGTTEQPEDARPASAEAPQGRAVWVGAYDRPLLPKGDSDEHVPRKQEPQTVPAPIPRGKDAGAEVVASLVVLVGLGALAGILPSIRRFLSSLLLSRLFSRAKGAETLENPVRASIYEAIARNPGITMRALCEVMGLQRSAVRHHIEVLLREKQVCLHTEGRGHHYYTQGSRTRQEASATTCMYQPHRATIAWAILEEPGRSQSAVAQVAGLPSSRVHTYAKDLTAAGLVSAQREGRYLRYYPTGLLHKIANEQGLPVDV